MTKSFYWYDETDIQNVAKDLDITINPDDMEKLKDKIGGVLSVGWSKVFEDVIKNYYNMED